MSSVKITIANVTDFEMNDVPGILKHEEKAKGKGQTFELQVQGPDEVDGMMIEPVQGTIFISEKVHPSMFNRLLAKYDVDNPASSKAVGMSLLGAVEKRAIVDAEGNPVELYNLADTYPFSSVTVAVLLTSPEDRDSALQAELERTLEFYEESDNYCLASEAKEEDVPNPIEQKTAEKK